MSQGAIDTLAVFVGMPAAWVALWAFARWIVNVCPRPIIRNYEQEQGRA